MPSAPTLLAHAFGERYDLPLPLLLFVLGGGLVVALSFLLLVRRTVAPVSPFVGSGQPTLPPLRPLPTAASLAALVLLSLTGLGGSQELAENLLPTVFWLLVWIAVPLSCGLLGDWTQRVNPFAHAARLSGTPRVRRAVLGSDEPVRWPAWLGWWPAVGLLFLLACGELIFNRTATLPRVTAVGLLFYLGLSAFCGLLFGPAWLQRGEVFSVLFSTWGRLGWFRFGARGRRGLAGGLDDPFEPTASRVAFVLLLLVSVNVDGLLATPLWSRLQLQLPLAISPGTTALAGLTTVAFVVLAAAVGLAFTGFARASARLSGSPVRQGALTGLLPSLLPIAFGYLLAHNLQYLLVNAQLLFPLLGNPTGLPGLSLHLPAPFNDSFEVHRALLPSSAYWYLSLLAIVVVHVAAVLLAHRHFGRTTADHALARRSEYPWLVAMVGYTMLSLWLLAQPLVLEHS